MRKYGMIFKIIVSVLVFLLILIILVALYNALAYPVVQLFKRKNEFGYVINSSGGYEHRVKVQKIIGRSLGPKEYLFVEKNHRNKKANKMAAVKK